MPAGSVAAKGLRISAARLLAMNRGHVGHCVYAGHVSRRIAERNCASSAGDGLQSNKVEIECWRQLGALRFTHGGIHGSNEIVYCLIVCVDALDQFVVALYVLFVRRFTLQESFYHHILTFQGNIRQQPLRLRNSHRVLQLPEFVNPRVSFLSLPHFGVAMGIGYAHLPASSRRCVPTNELSKLVPL